jgi:small subunit ribosomal protein S16
MSLVMRFRQQGRKNAKTYRIVVAEKKTRRDGKYIANIGHYSPQLEILEINKEEVERWLKVGVQLSDKVLAAIKRKCPEALNVLKK